MNVKFKYRKLIPVLLLALTAAAGPVYSEDLISRHREEGTMQLIMQIDGEIVTAELIDSETTREFISMMPTTINLYDFYNRIKYCYFEEPLSQKGPKQLEYEPGDIAYWPEGNELLIYYRHDGKPMRSDIIVMARIKSGLEAIKEHKGSVEISFQFQE